MKERRTHPARDAGEPRPRPGDAASVDERIAADLGALRSVRDQDLPSLADTLRAARTKRPDPGLEPNGIRRILMRTLGFIRTRPLAAAAAVAVLLVVASMVVPVSYDRVTGNDVALTLAGGGLDMEQVAAVARDMKARLGAEGVHVEAQSEDSGTRFTLRATAPKRSRNEVAQAASGLVRELSGKGVTASVHVSPHKERVRYPVAAYAWDQIIQISVDGKSASQLENEIRQRLAEAGVPDAQVSVTDEAEGHQKVTLKVERQRTGDPSTEPREPMPQLVLTKDGAPLGDADGCKVELQKRKTEDGALTIIANVSSKGASAKAEVANAQAMSDADLANAISTQLRQGGLNVNVTVTNGDIKIEPVK